MEKSSGGTPAFEVSPPASERPSLRGNPRPRRFAAALVVSSVGAGLLLPVTAGSAHAAEVSYTTPGAHVFTVPEGVTSITFDLFGGDGYRGGVTGTSPNSWAGRATATLPVTPHERIQIVVGGAGGQGTPGNAGAGGFNGGGPGGAASGGGGGGASDVRRGSCAATGSCGLTERVLIAGGGGGTGAPAPNGGIGGNGGGLEGGRGLAATGPAPGGGGTGGGQGGPGAGGAAGDGAAPGGGGSLGAGGSGGAGGPNPSGSGSGGGGGGGGGGLYGGGGGGGGGAITGNGSGGGGGGGSGFGPAGTMFAGRFFLDPLTRDGLVTLTYTATASTSSSTSSSSTISPSTSSSTSTSTSTTSTTTPTPPTSVPPTTSVATQCAVLTAGEASFNAQIDAAESRVILSFTGAQREALLAQLELIRAQGNAQFDAQRATLGCRT